MLNKNEEETTDILIEVEGGGNTKALKTKPNGLHLQHPW